MVNFNQMNETLNMINSKIDRLLPKEKVVEEPKPKQKEKKK